MAMAALRQGITKGEWWGRSQGKLSTLLWSQEAKRMSSAASPPHLYYPEVTLKSALNLGNPADLDLLMSPDVQDALVRPVPCGDGDKGAIFAAESALGFQNAEFHQRVCLEKVVSAHVLRRGWSIYSVSFEGSDRKGAASLYHAYVLNDPATRMTTLFKCGTVNKFFPKPSVWNNISQPPGHSVDISRSPVDISRSIADAVIPVNITSEQPRHSKLLRSGYLDDLLDDNIKDSNIRFWDLTSASELEIDGGVFLHFLVVRSKVIELMSTGKLGIDGGEVIHFRNFLAIINLKFKKLFMFRPVDELF